MKRQGIRVGAFEFSSLGDLGGRVLSFITPIKDTTLKRNRLDY